MEISGSPDPVTRLKILGACPRIDSANKTREALYRALLPAEKALVKTAALIMSGKTLIPARLIAMTYGLREGGKTQDVVRKTGNVFTSGRRSRLPATSPDRYMERAYR